MILCFNIITCEYKVVGSESTKCTSDQKCICKNGYSYNLEISFPVSLVNKTQTVES